MRKLLIVLALASLVALGIGGSAGADNGADWLAAGTGTLVNYGQPMVHVNAQSDFGGANPRGHFWIRYPSPGADFGGLVRCLDVVGNEAGLIGEIEVVNAAGNPVLNVQTGNFIYISINDNGSPGTALPTPDTANFDPATTSNSGSCPPRFNTPDLAISQGNYVVHDQPVTDPLQLDLLNQFLTQIESAANDPYG
jgi:hypothetical protein